MSAYLSESETADWVETVCAAIDRLVSNGVPANEAFASLPDGLPDQSRNVLRLYWEVTRETRLGRSVVARSFAATYRAPRCEDCGAREVAGWDGPAPLCRECMVAGGYCEEAPQDS